MPDFVRSDEATGVDIGFVNSGARTLSSAGTRTGGLLLRGVTGKRAGRLELFLFGSIKPEFEEPFFVNRLPIAKVQDELFWVFGLAACDVTEPFTVEGPFVLAIEEPFNLNGGGFVMYDEGGMAQPPLGYWEDRDIDVTTGVR